MTVLPNDNLLYPKGILTYVGGGGDVRILTYGGDDVTFKNLQGGYFMPIFAKKIFQTGTTATSLLATKADSILVASCPFPNATFFDGNNICDWSFRYPITIDHTKVAGDLTNYLFYVDLSDLPSAFFSSVNPDGSDIRITISDGETELAYYVSSIDNATNTGALWIRYEGTLSSTVDTTIYIYFGNPLAVAYLPASLYGRNATFQDYEAFWDFEQDPSGSAPQLIDLTGNSADATATGLSAGDLIAGKVGSAWGFGNNEYASYSRFEVGTNNLTIGGWAKWTTTSTRGIFGASRVGATYRYQIAQTAGNTLSYVFSTSTSFNALSAVAANDGNWKHLVMTVQRSTGNGVKGYLNGAFDVQSTTTPNNIAITGANNPTWRIAHLNDSTGTGLYANADLEGDISLNYLRFDVLSSDYISTEYANQNTPSTFYTIGTIES